MVTLQCKFYNLTPSHQDPRTGITNPSFVQGIIFRRSDSVPSSSDAAAQPFERADCAGGPYRGVTCLRHQEEVHVQTTPGTLVHPPHWKL